MSIKTVSLILWIQYIVSAQKQTTFETMIIFVFMIKI